MYICNMKAKDLVIESIRTGNWASDNIQEVLKPYELSMQQFNVLRILRGQKGVPANLSDIQERMISKMSNTTRLVDKLIQKKYVNRIICPNNRRKVEITITKDGLEILKTIDPIIDQREKEMTNKLSKDELAMLTTLLLKLKQ